MLSRELNVCSHLISEVLLTVEAVSGRDTCEAFRFVPILWIPLHRI